MERPAHVKMWLEGSASLDGERQPQNTMKTAKLVLQLILLLFLALCPQKVDAALSVDELKKSVSDSNPIYDVPDGQLKDVVTGLKPYGMILLVTTADPRFGCDLCGQFEPVYAKIVHAVYQKYPALKNEAFFLRVEAANHLEYLKELGVTSVPRVWGFPNSKGVLGEEKFNKVKSLLEEQKQALASGGMFIEPEWYDLKQAGMEHFVFELAKGDNWEAVIGKFAGFLSNTLHVDVNAALVEGVKKSKIDWFVTVQWFVYFLLGVKVLQKMRQNSEEGIRFWVDRRLYAYLSIVLIFICVSGFNFTTQRGSPFVSQKDGKVLWIAPTSTTQFGSEIIISVLLHVAFTGVLIFLIDGSRLVQGVRRSMALVVASVLLAYVLMLGANIYAVKSPGYPLNYVKLM